MSFVKLDETHQKLADSFYSIEKQIINSIELIQNAGNNRWLSVGRTDIEKGFMCIRKGIVERFQAVEKQKENLKSLDE